MLFPKEEKFTQVHLSKCAGFSLHQASCNKVKSELHGLAQKILNMAHKFKLTPRQALLAGYPKAVCCSTLISSV